MSGDLTGLCLFMLPYVVLMIWPKFTHYKSAQMMHTHFEKSIFLGLLNKEDLVKQINLEL